MLAGPVGRLEALLEEPEEGEPREAVLVCHPHPQHGGTMHNKVVYRLARGLRSTGCVVLRFNYRGVNLSEGEYGHGIGESEDSLTALQWLRERYPGLPFSMAGFSFGSRIVLRLGCAMPEVRQVIAAGFPTTYKDRDFLKGCTVPKVFLHSTKDVHGPKADLQAVFDGLEEPKQLYWVEAEDHFFKGALDEFERLVVQVS